MDIKATCFYISHDLFCAPIKWVTQTLHPSAAAPAPLSHVTTHNGSQVDKFSHPSSRQLSLYLFSASLAFVRAPCLPSWTMTMTSGCFFARACRACKHRERGKQTVPPAEGYFYQQRRRPLFYKRVLLR